jgi:hypothetical protein
MATQAQIDAAWRRMMKLESALGNGIALRKQLLKGYISDTLTWIEANQASYNSSLSTEAQAGLTQRQKALGFMLAAEEKYGVF